MEKFRIFIVEDDPWYGEILQYHLALNPDYDISLFTTAGQCLAQLHRKPDLITIDYTLPDGNGLQLLKKIKETNASIPVIVISAQENITTAVEILKSGASDYFIKDDNTKDLLWNAVIRIREHQSLVDEVEHLREELGHKYDFSKLIKGNSVPLQKVFSLIEKAVRTNINVSITGETGTGKEVVAKAVHYNSDRKNKPLVAVNMAAIPRELIESELFGYEKGAFTGALNRKAGKFEEANKGTIFLDEIAELDMSVQSKLLRVLQEREIYRVGGNERVALDVRIIVATHKNLFEEVRKGNFREDLYYRIIGLPIDLPPLRERGGDILLLARFFLDEFCKANKMPVIALHNDAKDKLMKYAYPGNVRELKALIDLAAVMCDEKEIMADDITFNTVSGNEVYMTQEKTLKEFTNDIIRYFLNKYDNDVLRVADILDIGKSTIYKKIQDKEIMLN
ncbi:MAG: sigma-54-dependent Fis family transcriptional regulator [Taibaiella sp.]|nr:sigma-54-dependent Fis family transcriptional regulator [Taibaiella sp.]